MGGQHPELAVHRHHRARTQKRENRAELLRAPVAGDVDGRVVLVQDLRPGLREPVDRVVHAQLVPWDRLRRDDHGVAALDGDGRMVVVRDPRQRRHRLTLAAGAQDHLLVRRQLRELVRAQQHAFWHLQIAEVAGDVQVLPHRAADERDLAVALDCDVDGLLHAMDVRREGRDEHASRTLRDDLAKGLADDALGLGHARPLGVRRVAEQQVDAAVPELRELADVRLHAVDRRVVDLVVACVHDPAAGRVDRDRDRVRNRVRHADELDPERADLDRALLRLGFAQLCLAQQSVLVELRLDEAHRQPGRPHLADPDLTHQVGQRADVILVPVRQQHGPDHVLALAQVAEVRQDEVDAEVLVPREGESGVDHDDRVVRLDHGHVLADLTEAAERDDPGGSAVHRASVGRPGRSMPRRSNGTARNELPRSRGVHRRFCPQNVPMRLKLQAARVRHLLALGVLAAPAAAAAGSASGDRINVLV